ncbi:MAG: ribosome maturation factor RimM [Bacteroidales bacterium]
MKVDDCYFLGYISKSFGYKGEVILFIDADEPQKYLQMESVFINQKGKLIPFFIENIQAHSKYNQLIAKFEDIDSEEQACSLIGNELFLPLKSLPQLKGNKFYFHEVIGFELSDKNKGMVGEIKDIIDLGANPLFQVFSGNKEILLPVQDDFIKSVDRKKQIIYYDAPDGLIDMYMNEEQ